MFKRDKREKKEERIINLNKRKEFEGSWLNLFGWVWGVVSDFSRGWEY